MSAALDTTGPGRIPLRSPALVSGSSGEGMERDPVAGHPSLTVTSALCSATPSAPRSIVSQTNGSVVVLEWNEPLENGGREDVAYHVLCSEHLDQQPHRPCTRLVYAPRARGLVDRTVTVEGLQPYITYSFQIQAVNGISDLSQSPPQGETITVSTSKDGALVSLKTHSRRCDSPVALVSAAGEGGVQCRAQRTEVQSHCRGGNAGACAESLCLPSYSAVWRQGSF